MPKDRKEARQDPAVRPEQAEELPVEPEEEPAALRISVRSLVEFLLRSGDLDSRRRTTDPEAMLKGGALHRKLQKAAGGDYRAEVPLKLTSHLKGFDLTVEGRADGIYTEKAKKKRGRKKKKDNGPAGPDGLEAAEGAGEQFPEPEEPLTWVDEIKGTYADLDRLEEPVPVHLAQARCYAHFLCVSEGFEKIGVRMSYVHLISEKPKTFHQTYTSTELKQWYESLLLEYEKWISTQLAWRKKRNASMKDLAFPFPYREGQRRLVSSVYHAISQGQQLFACAPTGVGKTMSTIFPAVRAVGEGLGDRIFYLTAKTITRTVAMEAFSILKEKGLSFKVLVITAKEKLCPNEEVLCRPDKCPYARGHFDRINEAVYDLWTQRDSYDRETILSWGRKFMVCPFELSLDLALWVDALVCDYNYCFDPDVALKRFFAEGSSGQGEYLFLIDEAHNLVERARQMYSASLGEADLMAGAMAAGEDAKLAHLLWQARRALQRMGDELPISSPLAGAGPGKGFFVTDLSQALMLSLLAVQTQIEAQLSDPEAPEPTDELMDFYFLLRSFDLTAELVGEDYLVYLERDERKELVLHLSCMDPARNLAARLEKGRSAIFFSATLLPLGFYRRLLSTRADDFGIVLPSPFPRENRLILLGTDVDTRYKSRGPALYEKLARYLALGISGQKGNYLAFFPSYRMMEEVAAVFEREYALPWVRTLCQTPSMEEREREEFLAEFDQAGEGTLLGFAILGGIFSEGIDFLGNRLIGAFIVGPGLPQVGTRQEALKYFYDQKKEDGFAYAYRYPGMNKVLQAAGRVIRTREDRGVIFLLDERFGQASSRSLFPADWEGAGHCSLGSVKRQLEDFWKGAYHEED